MNRLLWIFTILSIYAMSTFLMISCAGNQAGGYSEDGLYPGETAPDDEVASASSEEDEVLRLLGIVDEEEPPATEPVEEPVVDQDWSPEIDLRPAVRRSLDSAGAPQKKRPYGAGLARQ